MRIITKILAVLIILTFVSSASAQETTYTYTNQEQDQSGLLHYDSRYYDPDLGRFLQPDTLDVPNKYAYVSNDPVNYIDPTGNSGIPTADDFFFPPQNSYIFSGIDPTNTDTYSAMFSDPLTIDNNFIVGDMVGPWGDLGSNLYLDAADDIAKERAYYQSNDARFILSYEDYKRGVHPLYVDSSFGVNPVGIIREVEKALTKAGMIYLVEKEVLTEKQAIELINKASNPFTGKQVFTESCVGSACNTIIKERNGVGTIIFSEGHAFAVSANEQGAIRVFDKKPFVSFYHLRRSSNLTIYQDLISNHAMSPQGAAINDYFLLKLEKAQWLRKDPTIKTFNYFYWDW